MIKRYFKKMFTENREFILKEVLSVKGLFHLLMKHRNTGQKWTIEELKEIRLHLRNISRIIPVVIIFLLPGGSFLLPFLVEVIDRRTNSRA